MAQAGSVGQTERRFIFNNIAELYDRARPGYPAPLIDDIIALSGIPPTGRILEIGCGPGKATVYFAQRGFEMLCLEPGAELARVARRKLEPHGKVRVVESTFESWPLEPRAFDLIICAQAFHWLAPDVRFVKTAAALREGGTLAVFGNSVACRPSPMRDALDEVYRTHAPELARREYGSWHGDVGTVIQAFRESNRFQPVRWLRYSWSVDYTPQTYVELLRTHSDHQALPSAQLETLASAVERAIEAQGGRITIPYETHLYAARRTSAGL
jgi:SAM-dependent methyltransferase